ncbi:glutamine synthetase/guanido kinase [Gonapodya prolifera JEL478]|uniref:Glutamine synthetase/guanido kinase n=1 Tax=Gonapodya prolifera (strain JEL478) TaxID=1344416 RepID=A0A139AHB7_GONPJ|nr:glutamine synthetase/guanido kinase [Gonapodya prolifera JEL478]|eukprot:KXS16211.1 glutamine synthetase/guanido kinase [Gonapodya prolifera JEL478]
MRAESAIAQLDKPVRSVDFPQTSKGLPESLAAFYGQNVFTLKKMQETLPKPIYQRFLQQTKGRGNIDKPTAEAIAHAVRIWAQERGATHFTHWFQPQTDGTAEKHDSFLSLKSVVTANGEEVLPFDGFSGGQLLQSEPDASSFPSGGRRTTFEARGYTIWDPMSPMFLEEGPHGTTVLYIPCVFISYYGEALDEKTILLRSNEAVSRATVRLLHLIGETDVKKAYTTLGTEQEYFLVDRALYSLRPDLKLTGRTLIGSVPPKHQQLEDHYFGRIPGKVLACVSEAELECWKLGVPLKTRHNEVAPSQFEVAPIFEESSQAVDHNLLTMMTLSRIAHRYSLKALFHEKPFKGVNGSGKHCNWAIATDLGDNLLDPTVRPETNYRFLLFLVGILRGVHLHAGVLRAGIASASNDMRLGANEAPPGIISAFLGEQLSEVLAAVYEGRDIKSFSVPSVQSVKVGGTVLDLKISTLPTVPRDLTDRNRTSPFAFTGNKFEFRAVGSHQNPSWPVTILNAIVSSALNDVSDMLEKQKGSKASASVEDILTVVKELYKEHKAIIFEGDNYSAEWAAEAEKRGLPNIKKAVEAFQQLKDESHIKVLTKESGVFTEEELISRYHILLEKYIKDIQIEAGTLKLMITQGVLPASYEYRLALATTVKAVRDAGGDPSVEKAALDSVGEHLAALQPLTKKLDEALAHLGDKHGDEEEHSKYAAYTVVPLMDEIREHADALEEVVADKYWPYPKYHEILFGHA